MTARVRILFVAGALLAVAGVAGAAPAAKEIAAEHRLTAAEIDAVLAAAARRRGSGDVVADAKGAETAALRRPLVEGEVGFGIGTGGYRSAFGTAYVPLPGDGSLAVSFDTERGPRGY